MLTRPRTPPSPASSGVTGTLQEPHILLKALFADLPLGAPSCVRTAPRNLSVVCGFFSTYRSIQSFQSCQSASLFPSWVLPHLLPHFSSPPDLAFAQGSQLVSPSVWTRESHVPLSPQAFYQVSPSPSAPSLPRLPCVSVCAHMCLCICLPPCLPEGLPPPLHFIF